MERDFFFALNSDLFQAEVVDNLDFVRNFIAND